MPEGDPAKRTQECLLVLGMHRSGTSVVTRVASLMGANLPVHIMEAGLGNETGHWESQVLVDYHDALLSELGSRWDDWQPLEFERLAASRLEEIRSELWRVIAGEYGVKSPFVIKDPRICRFAHMFISLLDDNGILTRVLIPFRNPLEVIHSLQARDDMHRVDAAFLWLRHILDAENASRGHIRSFISYPELLETWRACWTRVSDDLKVVWPTQIEQVEDQIEQFINPKQRHHHHGDDELKLDPLLKQWIASAYNCLLELQKSSKSSNAIERLDRISHQITEASPTLFQAISQIRRSYEEQIAEHKKNLTRKEQEITRRDQIIAHHDRLVADRDKIIAHIYGSFSWKATKPLRKIQQRMDSLWGNNRDCRELTFSSDHADTGVEFNSNVPEQSSDETTVFFTICARNFMAFARTLYSSLQRFYPDIRFYVALCDELGEPFDPSSEPFPFVYLDDLGLPDWREMSQRYNITEFNTSIKPFVFKYLFEAFHADNVIYMDPDIYVTNRLSELERALVYKKSAILTPHMLEPAEKAEMNEKRLLQYGIYNLGFLALRNTPEVRNIVEWWGRRLVTECVIDRQEGLFVDQKWADHFPAFLEDAHVLRHPGYNVAYWNLSSRNVKWNGEQWMVNGEPLRFVHFSGSKLDDPDVFSRHSSEHTLKTIGPLKVLLEEYRELISKHNHNHYRTIPYAFSWSGEKGVNEHTPKPEKINISNTARLDNIRGISSIKRSVWPLWANVRQIYHQEGLKGIKLRVKRRLINSGTDTHGVLTAIDGGCVDEQYQSFKKKILFVEHTTPKPDKDAGSLAAFNILKALSLIGYNLTFLPLDLSYDDKNSPILENFGINCLHIGNIQSIGHYLKKEGHCYDFLFLNRGPVVAPYLDIFKRNCVECKNFTRYCGFTLSERTTRGRAGRFR